MRERKFPRLNTGLLYELGSEEREREICTNYGHAWTGKVNNWCRRGAGEKSVQQQRIKDRQADSFGQDFLGEMTSTSSIFGLSSHRHRLNASMSAAYECVTVTSNTS